MYTFTLPACCNMQISLFYHRMNHHMSKNEKLSRHAQRCAVFAFIFEHFFRSDESPADIYLTEYEERGYQGYDYIRDTFLCAEQNADESDALIREYAVGWSLERISYTARAVLRLAIYELFHSDVPPKVVMNEAVEISKEFASEDEASFINGILNKIAHDKGVFEPKADGEVK